MSAEAHNPTNVPAALGGDLPERQELAVEEGHDADIPTSKEGEEPHSRRQHVAEKEASVGTEKHSDRQSLASLSSHGGKDVEKGVAEATAEATTEPRDPNIVDWDGPNDPTNPYNWTARKKWLNIGMLSFLTLLIPLASSMFAPGVPDVMRDFGTENESLATFVVSVYILGFALGPLVLAPLSEMYGRLHIYNVCNVLFTIFTVACALATNMNMLIGFRFLAGAVGIAPITNGGGTIADMMAPEQRGGAMAIWAIGPLLGPVIGPVCGGFLAEDTNWRWIFWVLAIAAGLATILAFFVSDETYAPVILERKTKRLRKETGNENLRSKMDKGITTAQLWKLSLLRPMKLMFLSVICALMSLYMAIVYGIMYLLFTTFTFVFQENYGFSTSIVGLVYIGLGIGMLLGLLVLGKTSDPIMKKLAAKHSDGKLKPEYRLPALMYSGVTIPIGLFIYGWTTQYHIHWIVPLVGTTFVGIGMIAAFMSINTYLIDAYTLYAASAMAANTVLRSIFGALFPLFGLQMYNGLGLGWGNSLLAFISLAMVPIPWGFYYYGERIRTHPKLQVNL